MSEIQSVTLQIQDLERSFDRWNTAYMIVLALTVVLAALLFVTQFVANRRGKQLSDAKSDLLRAKDAQLQSDLKAKDAQIAHAGARAEEAKEGAAKAEERAAEANKKAEEERLARVKIEEKLAPRRLAVEQQRQIAGCLQRFAGQRVNLFAYTGDQEVIGIANDIIAALRGPQGASWIVSIISGQEAGRGVAGILVEIRPDADGASRLAAASLVSSLRAERLSVSGPQALVWMPGMGVGQEDPNAPIRITIGRKP